jgi:hypothetical protein
VTNQIGTSIYRYFMKFGLVSSADFSSPILFTLVEKEETFNAALKDLYSWFLLILHTGVTMIIVWQFYSIWFLSIFLVLLVIMIFVAYSIVHVMMHLDVLERIRRIYWQNQKKVNVGE